MEFREILNTLSWNLYTDSRRLVRYNIILKLGKLNLSGLKGHTQVGYIMGAKIPSVPTLQQKHCTNET